MGIGIEKLNIYAGSLVLDIEKLAIARDRDVKFFKEELMLDSKSQNVDYEDVITMAVDAAKPIITKEDIEDIRPIARPSKMTKRILRSWVDKGIYVHSAVCDKSGLHTPIYLRIPGGFPALLRTSQNPKSLERRKI